ncbi:COMPASS complex protein [Thozetella sp. PMI_491]|nr:COMPASS complex protein [Thozetella sp. PMI_491]
MASEARTPQREVTPTTSALPSSIPQKRAIDEEYTPAVSSPLNLESKPPSKAQVQAPEDNQGSGREKRTKKDSLKKRESKGITSGQESSRATPDPKGKDPIPGELAPARYKIAHPKPTDFEPARGPVFISHHEVRDRDGRTIEFVETSEHVHNKKNFQYIHCIADPAFPSSIYYRQTEPEPHGPHMSFEDAASHMFFDKGGKHVTSNKGFRTSRANVAVREGRWYWECKITQGTLKTRGEGDPESHGHVRVGFARREASLDAPVGFDAYSYGIRDVAGQKVHMSRPKDFFPPGDDLREGDVIGLEIQLPSEHLHRKVVLGQYNPAVDLVDDEADPGDEAPNIVRDRIPIRFKAHIYFEKIDYHTTKELDDLMNPSPMSSSGSHGSSESPNPHHRTPALRTLPNSFIKIYKNGVLMGTPFSNLLAFLPPASKPLQQPGAREGLDDGMLGYYPAVSVFRGGAAEVNFGPKFWFPPPGFEKLSSAGEDVEMGDATATEPPPQPQQLVLNQITLGNDKIRAVSERYDEQIVEDIVYDLIDEVGFWVLDGGKAPGGTGKDGKVGETGRVGLAATGQEEIKEIIQDD